MVVVVVEVLEVLVVSRHHPSSSRRLISKEMNLKEEKNTTSIGGLGTVGHLCWYGARSEGNSVTRSRP